NCVADNGRTANAGDKGSCWWFRCWCWRWTTCRSARLRVGRRRRSRRPSVIRADANGVPLASFTGVPYIDVAIARSETIAGKMAHDRVVAAGGVLSECNRANGRVVYPVSVTPEPTPADVRVIVAGGVT